MPRIRIDGVPPYDGTYQIDLPFTNQELHVIKQVSGVRPAELQEAVANDDAAVLVAIAANVLRREGKQVSTNLLLAAESGKITIWPDEDEGDADPPPSEQSGSEPK